METVFVRTMMMRDVFDFISYVFMNNIYSIKLIVMLGELKINTVFCH